jgi:aldose sugar dehydrogenase
MNPLPRRAPLLRAAWLLALSSFAAAAEGPAPGIPAPALDRGPYVFDTAEQHRLRVVVVARGLPRPFSLALLPDGGALVSERGGNLRLIRDVTRAGALEPQPVAGLPKLATAFRNGGLHDLALHPQFASNGLVYFTFNKAGTVTPAAGGQPARVGSITTLMRARYSSGALTEVKELYSAVESGTASGSRIAFDGAGHVFITTGAPFGPEAQQPAKAQGKVLRLNEDGSVPADNPFVKQAGTRPEIYSLGHRDPLGLTISGGRVFSAEHGPNGGDEVNLILPGRNYGWPTATFGHGYDGAVLAESPLGAGFEPPMLVWIPSIGPSGLQFYGGDRFPRWKGNLFVGSVRRGQLPGTGGLERVVLNDKLQELRRETLLGELHQRVRDVRQGADGLLYVVTDEADGALLRLEPAD